MASSDDIKLTIEVDAEGGIRALDRFGNEIKVTQDKSGGLEKALASTELKIISLDAALNLASRGLNTIRNAFSTVADVVGRGDQYNDVADAFEQITAKAGSTADVFANQLRTATRNTISDFDLFKLSNDALLAGLKPDQFLLVAQVAKQYGDALGKEAPQAINELSNAIQTGNERTLKQYGIVLDTNSVLRDYAAANGLVAEKLDEGSRLTAVREAALKRLSGALNTATNDEISAGTALEQVNAAYENLTDKLSGAIEKSPAVAAGLQAIRDAIKAVDIEQLARAFDAVGAALQRLAALMPEVGGAVSQFFDTTTAAIERLTRPENFQMLLRLLPATSAFQSHIDAVSKAEAELAKQTAEANAKLDAQMKAFSPLLQGGLAKGITLLKEYGAASEKAGDQFEKSAEDQIRATKDLASKIREVLNLQDDKIITDELARKKLDELRATSDKLGVSTEQYDRILRAVKDKLPEVVAAQRKHEQELRRQQEILEKLNSVEGLRGLQRSMEDVADAYLDGIISAERLGDELIRLEANFLRLGGTLQDLENVSDTFWADFYANQKKHADDAKKQLEDQGGFLEGLLGFDISSGALADNFGQKLGEQLNQVFSQAFSVLKDGRVTRDEAAEAGSVVGTVLGTAIGAAISGGTGAVVGGSIGSAVGNIIGEIASAFGEDGAGTKARKAADKFFAEIFDSNRLSVIVNGELAQIDDLVFNGLTAFNGQTHIGDELFSSYFDSLEPSARNAFDGVGKAFAEMLGQFDILGTQLGAVFANNVGGSLNNLQLLVQATGKTFEELRGTVVEAFLDGKLSALEAQSAINGIAQVMQDGIPDGVGLIEKAFENLQAATSKGGRALVDALQDVGFEAKELGIKDFPALEAEMKRRMPAAADHIAQVFDTLRQHGIDSIEELTGATVEELLPVLSALEVNEFPFAKATEDLEDLVETARELRDEYRTRIVVDYVKNDPDGVQQDIQEAQRATGQSRGIP